MKNQQHGICDGEVMRTLLIPLCARASEMDEKSPIVMDKKAHTILQSIDIEGNIVDGGNISTHGILSRTKVIDDSVRKLLSNSGSSVIINLGVGLDTRIDRLDNDWTHWYDIDFPEVIKMRKKYFSEYMNISYHSGSILNYDWKNVMDTQPANTTIIIAEGLLMYFEESDVITLFEYIATHFPSAHMFFDVVGTYFVGKGISANFQWGLDNAADIIKMVPSASLLKTWATGDLYKSRQPIALRVLNILPQTRKRSQVLHIQF